MAYKHGNFVWFECVVPDVDKAKAFYPETLGWKTEAADMGDFQYTMFSRGEAPFGGLTTPQGGPQPPHWTAYLSVADVDAALKAVEANGGKVLGPAFDIPTVGRMAPVADPQGATFFLFKGDSGDNESADGMHWTELWAKDAPAVLSFYEAVVGVKAEKMDNAQMDYWILKGEGDKALGGLMSSPDPKVPPMWLSYAEVDDPDATLERATQNGGKTIKPAETMEGIGRFGILADNQGAVLGIIKPATQS